MRCATCLILSSLLASTTPRSSASLSTKLDFFEKVCVDSLSPKSSSSDQKVSKFTADVVSQWGGFSPSLRKKCRMKSEINPMNVAESSHNVITDKADILRKSFDKKLSDDSDEGHFRHKFYNELMQIRQSNAIQQSSSNMERTQFVRPISCSEVQINFLKLSKIINESERFITASYKFWLAFYVGICSDSCTHEDFIDFAERNKVEPKHLVSFCEITNDLRNFVINRKESLEITPHEKIARLAQRFYTMEREVGGPYFDINADFQHDKINELDAVLGSEKSLVQPLKIVCFGFHYLYHNHFDTFGIDGAQTVWRGMKELDEEQWELFVSQTSPFYWQSFVSTSADRSIAEKFCRLDFEHDKKPGPNSVLFKINLPEEAFALSLKEISAIPKEEEILLFPYHKFELISVEHSQRESGLQIAEKVESSSPSQSTGCLGFISWAVQSLCGGSESTNAEKPRADKIASFPGRGIIELKCLGCEFRPLE